MKKLIVNNYASFDVIFQNGQGSTMWDVNGKKYIDFIAGIGVNCLGHNYAPLVDAIQNQAEKQIHVSNYYFSESGVRYAESLLKYTGFSGAYFGNSGAEANEAAIKLARKYGELNGGAKRKTIVTLSSSFHGRTLATLTATGQDVFHPECFAPYPQGFKTIQPNDYNALNTAFDETTAAFFVECIQGEGGVNLLDKDWICKAASAARKAGAIVMADEVQTGVGRTGDFFASTALEFDPEVVTLAKGIAGGIPMGACLFKGRASNVFSAGDHQSTFAGNPLACAAALVVLDTVSQKKFLERVQTVGNKMRKTIKEWKSPIVCDVRGKGLMIGVQIDKKIKPFDIETRCLEKGLCTTTAGNDVIRFLPPLNISDKEVDEGLCIFHEVLNEWE